MRKAMKYIWKILVWGISALLVLAIISAGILFFIAQPYLNKNLSQYVSEKTGGVYSLNFENIELNFRNKGFTITGVNLHPIESKAREIQQTNPERIFYSFSTSTLQIQKLKLLKAIKKRQLIMDKVSIVKPGFSLSGSINLSKDSIKPFDYAMAEMKLLFNKYLDEVVINEIEFVDANYQFYNLVGDTSNVSNAEKISVGITHFRTDSALLKKPTSPFETDDIFIRMNNFMNQMGDSIHFLEIDALEYSFKKAILSASNFHLFPKYPAKEKSLYDIFVPSFNLRSNSLISIYTTDSLSVAFCEFNNPEINFYQKNNLKKLDIEDINNFDLYDLVKHDFKIIQVDTFLLHDASLEISRQEIDSTFQQKFETIQVGLQNFTLSPTSNKNPDKLLFADEIEMNIGGYLLNLDDGIHTFKAETISASTYTNTIKVGGLSINPKQEGNNVKHPIFLHIGCQQLSFNDISLKDVYHKRILPATSIEIIAPTAQFDYHTDARKKASQGQVGVLFDIVSSYLKGVYSNVVAIEDGALKIQNLRRKKVRGFFETGINFSLTDFALDSTSLESTDKLFYASNFDLQFTNYNMKLVDNLHKLRVGNILISSNESKVIIDSLHLRPVAYNIDEELLKRYNRSEAYTVFVPRITIMNAGLHKAFFENNVQVENLRFHTPTIHYENFSYLKKNRKQGDFTELYDLIFNYAPDISIRNISAPEGEITWVNHAGEKRSTTLTNKFDVELINFKLNKNELNKKRLLFSDHIAFSLRDQLFKLSDNVHYLQAKEINFSTEKSSIEFTDALFYPDITSPDYQNKPTTFQVTIPKLLLSDVDIPAAYFSQDIKVGNIHAGSPKVEVYSQKGKTKPLDFKKLAMPLPPHVNTLDVKKIELNDGRVITYQLEDKNLNKTSSFNLGLLTTGFMLDEDKFSTEGIIANVSNFRLALKGKTHEISVGQLNYHKEAKSIDIQNFHVSPSLQQLPKNQFSIQIPSIAMEGFDTDLAYEENIYALSQINVVNPSIKISMGDTLKPGGLKKLRGLDFYQYVGPYLNQLNITNLAVNHAEVDFGSLAKGLKHEDINIAIRNIEIGEHQLPGRLLNAEDFFLKTYNISRASKNGLYSFLVDTFIFQSSDNSIGLKNIHIKPVYTKDKFAAHIGTQVDVLDSHISSVKLENLDVDKWMYEQKIEAGNLHIGPSSTNIFRNKRYPFNPVQSPLLPKGLLATIPYPFKVDSTMLYQAKIKYSELLDVSNTAASIIFDDIDISMGQLSNIPAYLNKTPMLSVAAKGIVNQAGKIDARFRFDLSDKKHSHSVEGNIQPMPMNTFNDFAEKAALVTVEDGLINRFEFNMELDDEQAIGNLWLGYNDLKVAVIEFEDGKIKKEGFASLMANSLLVNSKNPKGKELLPQEFTYTRDPKRSMINYWWKSIFSGAKQSMGIKDKNKK